MRMMVALVIAWLVLSAIILVTGNYLITKNWKQQGRLRFDRDLKTISAHLSQTQWQHPLSAHDDWALMEETFRMGVVPTLPGAASQSPTMSRWVKTGRGNDQLRAEIEVKLTTDDPAVRNQQTWLQVTRQFQKNELLGLWWRFWCTLSVTGTLALAFAAHHVHANSKAQSTLLMPWVDSCQESERPLQLSKLECSAPMQGAADFVANSINESVSRLTLANQRSDLVLGNLEEGVLAVNHRCQVLLANRALHTHLELLENRYLYRPLLEVIRTPQIFEIVQQILAHRISSEEITEIGPRSLRIIGRSLPLADGREGALITTRDETLLRRIDAVRKDFISNASHELKTPLAAIRAYAETLQLGALDDKEAAESFVGNIISQADRIGGLVQGMLQLSRVESGHALNNEEFDATKAIESCMAAAKATSRSKSLELCFNLPQTPILLYCDRGGFQTIVSNLLSNAIRYTPDGGRVTVTLKESEQSCLLTVEDTGIGIAQADLERIFERFYRAEKGRSSDSGGTGLGLSIVKHLTNALGGTVTAQSTFQKGSCFEVSLPMRPTSSPNLHCQED